MSVQVRACCTHATAPHVCSTQTTDWTNSQSSPTRVPCVILGYLRPCHGPRTPPRIPRRTAAPLAVYPLPSSDRHPVEREPPEHIAQ
eukprot:scaffold15918_cov73-Phaeocystis_antarctica.AAC.7